MADSFFGSLYLTPQIGRRGDRDFVQWIGDGFEMLPREMQIDGRIADVGMAEQFLNAGEVGAGFQQMCREAMSKGVRMNK